MMTGSTVSTVSTALLFFLLHHCTSFFFGSTHLNVIDKSHIKNHADSWLTIWRQSRHPLANLRQKECIDSVLWCEKIVMDNDFHCITYQDNKYLLFLETDDDAGRVRVHGLLENPDNDYYTTQAGDIHAALVNVCNQTNYVLNYSNLKIWSHGFYFDSYQNKEFGITTRQIQQLKNNE